MKDRIVWFRSWHTTCTCFWDIEPGVVIAETRRHYLVQTTGHGIRKLAKWRVIEKVASDADA